MAAHREELAAWKATPKADRIGDEPEPPPPCEHPLCVDVTAEALAVRLLATPRGTLVAPDELGAWLGSFDRYRDGADVAAWLALHGARALKIDRKMGDHRTIYVPHAAVCVTGTIQPATLRRALLPEFFDCGLAARLLVTMPPATPKRWSEHEIGESTQRAVDELFARLFELRPATGTDAEDEPVMVDLLPAAKAAWVEWVNGWNDDMQAIKGNAHAAAAKLEGYAARFALIFHCCRQASGEKASDYIDADDIANGVKLARWFGVETLRVYRVMSESEEDRLRRQLLEWIAAHGGRVTTRQVQHGLGHFQENPAEAEPALWALVDAGYGSWEHVPAGPRGGRPTDYFCLADSPDFTVPNPDTPENPEEIRVLVSSLAKSNGKHVSPSPREARVEL
jgi:hypothetical protein